MNRKHYDLANVITGTNTYPASRSSARSIHALYGGAWKGKMGRTRIFAIYTAIRGNHRLHE